MGPASPWLSGQQNFDTIWLIWYHMIQWTWRASCFWRPGWLEYCKLKHTNACSWVAHKVLVRRDSSNAHVIRRLGLLWFTAMPCSSLIFDAIGQSQTKGPPAGPTHASTDCGLQARWRTSFRHKRTVRSSLPGTKAWWDFLHFELHTAMICNGFLVGSEAAWMELQLGAAVVSSVGEAFLLSPRLGRSTALLLSN